MESPNPSAIIRKLKHKSNPSLSIDSPGINVSSPMMVPNSPDGKQPGVLLPMPAEGDLERMFENIIDDLNLSDVNKEKVRNLSVDRKWLIVQSHLNGKNSKDVLNDGNEVTYFKDGLLSQDPTPNVLKALGVCLRSKPIKWVNTFIESDSFSLLVSTLQKAQLPAVISSHEEIRLKQ